MNGIKGISLITSVFGFTFLDLYNAPITKKSLYSFYRMSSHPLFFVFYFGIKYAPKLILCSSGFSLFYKFMNFLDDKVELEKEMKEVNYLNYLIQSKYDNKSIDKNLNDNNNKIIDNLEDNKDNDKKFKNGDDIVNKNNNSKIEENEDNPLNQSGFEKQKIKNNKKILPFKYYFLFLLRQLHKYILYLLLLFFTLYSLYDVLILISNVGPLWHFFKIKMINTSLKISNLIPAIFCYQGSFLNKFDTDSLFPYFYLIYQEVIFFIVSSLIIFIGFKYNLRIDRFILAVIFLFYVVRSSYYYLSGNLNIEEYFDLNNYGYFFNSPFFNYLYYAFGIYFGAINYVIQKG